MNTQIPDVSAPFLQAHGELLSFVESCDEAHWRAIPTTEQRSVGVLAYHVALGYMLECELIRAVVSGQALPAIYLDTAELDASNAANAHVYHNCTKEETLALLRQNAAATVECIRALGEAELSRSAHVPILAPWFGDVMSVRQLVEGLLPTHIHMHLAEMRAAKGTA